MIPMIEMNTEGNSCGNNEVCGFIAQNFTQTFVSDGYIISRGAAMVCEVEGDLFMRGLHRKSIAKDVNSRASKNPKKSNKFWR